jgi:hypothetical protein
VSRKPIQAKLIRWKRRIQDSKSALVRISPKKEKPFDLDQLNKMIQDLAERI